MKGISRVLSILMSAILVVGLMPTPAIAATAEPSTQATKLTTMGSPSDYGIDLLSYGYQSSDNIYKAWGYGSDQPNGAGGECTWYVWGRVYEKTGGKERLSFHGDAKDWPTLARDAEYRTGGEAEPDCIMVEDAVYPGMPTGHVFYVERVEAGKAYVTEGNWNGVWHDDVVDLSTQRRESSPYVQMGALSYVYITRESPITATASPKSVGKNGVDSAAKTVSAIEVSDAVGKVTYEKVSGDAALTVGKTSGKVTVSKGASVGKHSMAVSVSDAGGDGYEGKSVPVTVEVTVVKNPAAPKKISAKAAPAGFKASWSKVPGAAGYELLYASGSSATKGKTVRVEGASSTSRSISGLAQKRAYAMTVRSYVVSNGTRIYSKWQPRPASVKTLAKLTTYTVEFKANGGKGAMGPQMMKRGSSTALRANVFARSGYKFAGWNTKANGKGKSYKNKAKVRDLAKAGKTVTLYAQWKRTGSYTFKTRQYTFTLPTAWRGKVECVKRNSGTASFNGKSWPDGVTMYLRGHKGDSRYAIGFVGYTTGFGEGVVVAGTKELKNNYLPLGIFVYDAAYRIWRDRNSSYSSDRLDIPVSDQKKILELVTGGKISYDYAAVNCSDPQKSADAIYAYLKPMFEGSVKA